MGYRSFLDILAAGILTEMQTDRTPGEPGKYGSRVQVGFRIGSLVLEFSEAMNVLRAVEVN